MLVVLRLRYLMVGLIVASGVLWLAVVAMPPVARVVIATMKERRVPVYKVARDDMKMAVSLDATWGVDYTDDLLDLFDEMDMKTTFFLAGYWIEKYPDYVKKIADRGHEIGNHSYAHPHMNAMTKAAIIADLKKNHDLLKDITGVDVTLFRPPFGEYSDKVIEAAEELGYLTIQWSVDSLDWKDVSASFMVERVMGRAGPGEIVLFHNAGIHTLEALRTILPRLKEAGFEVVPVSQVVYTENYIIESHSGLQKPVTPPPLPSNEESGEEESAPTVTSGAHQPVASGGESGTQRASFEPAVSPLLPKNQAVRHVEGADGYVALTVNVDWGNDELLEMLDIFDAYEVKATFFPTGRWARAFPDYAQAIALRGHEIGSHGLRHDMPTSLGEGALVQHIAEGITAVEEATGSTTVPLYAPPAGDHNDRVVATAASLNLWTTLWTYDTIDWQDPAPSVIYDRIVPRAESGGIVLMHPKSVTVSALGPMIEGLRAKGLQPIPLYEMMQFACEQKGECY